MARGISDRYIPITDDVHYIILKAWAIHGGSYHSLATTLNFDCGRSARDLVQRKAQYILRSKYELLKCLTKEMT